MKQMNKIRFIILGDLHFEQKTAEMVIKAFAIFKQINPDFMISLGDLGGYSHPGTQLSFDEAKSLFAEFNFPVYPLLGNHDLEGLEFRTDQANINAWLHTFNQKSPYYSLTKGSFHFIFLSTTRFRKNPQCCHEVYIDDDQFLWFEKEIKSHQNKNIFVFSHAPIIGSGIRVLQNLHLRGGNAWLNHSQHPEKFIRLVSENPQIKFWASGHNHLSQEYPDALSLKNKCLFCHTGVVNNISRDGRRQSRLIEFDNEELIISSIDHDSSLIKPMANYRFSEGVLKSLTPLEIILDKKYFAPPPYESVKFLAEIGNSQFAFANGMIVEYLKNAKGPIGVLSDAVTDNTNIKIAGNLVEIWEGNQKVDAFALSELGTYSLPIGIKIEEHQLSQI